MGVPEVANLGIVRPPLVYLGSIVLGLLLHFASPIRLVPPAVAALLGGSVILVAVALFVFAVRAFREAGTPVPGNRPTTTIVHTGPYRFSRNPIYLSFTLLQLGISLWVNSLCLLLTLLVAVALMSFVVIPREERYLESRFPAKYLSVALYCAARLHETADAEDADIALAFPDDPAHRKLLKNISKALRALDVAVYFVGADCTMTSIESPVSAQQGAPPERPKQRAVR